VLRWSPRRRDKGRRFEAQRNEAVRHAVAFAREQGDRDKDAGARQADPKVDLPGGHPPSVVAAAADSICSASTGFTQDYDLPRITIGFGACAKSSAVT
jgi:hypothetical protein